MEGVEDSREDSGGAIGGEETEGGSDNGSGASGASTSGDDESLVGGTVGMLGEVEDGGK